RSSPLRTGIKQGRTGAECKNIAQVYSALQVFLFKRCRTSWRERLKFLPLHHSAREGGWKEGRRSEMFFLLFRKKFLPLHSLRGLAPSFLEGAENREMSG